MKKIEVHCFQNLTIKNATITNHPLTQAKDKKKDLLTIVFVRDPYIYFDYLLFDYLKHKRSILYTQDIINNMKELDNKAFLAWFETLNFMPFYNPQTFQLDISKRSLTAIKNLESFDYVVPYEEIDTFLKNVSPDIIIDKKEETKLFFSLSAQNNNETISKFIGKDLKLYERSLELWEVVKKNNFKPLGTLIDHKRSSESTRVQTEPNEIKNYKGIAGKITSHSIVGWVYHKEKQECVMVAIYKNNIFLRSIKADKMRKDLKKQQIHPTGQCGFEAIFDEPTFQKGDKIEIKILPGKISLPLGENINIFLGT